MTTRIIQASKLASSSALAGFTLLEVLVALFVLAIGLLGLAMLQTTGLRFNTNSYSRSQATYVAYDIIDRMRANKAGFTNGDYDVPNDTAASTKISNFDACKTAACKCDDATGATVCDKSNMATFDLGRWYQQQYLLLPGAAAARDKNQRATIVRAGNTATITLFWEEQDQDAFVTKSQVWQVEF
jgi:type IV pilus assembly protein PilV